jgi:C4-dicarboxylate-specific signal transduction histidine kinase
MNRLFTNLLQNAVEANTDTDAMVNVSINQRNEDGNVLISVKDDFRGDPGKYA